MVLHEADADKRRKIVTFYPLLVADFHHAIVDEPHVAVALGIARRNPGDADPVILLPIANLIIPQRIARDVIERSLQALITAEQRITWAAPRSIIVIDLDKREMPIGVR